MPHTAARAYKQRDSVQRRSHRPRHPPSHNRTLVSASAAASGLLTGYQGTDALANLPGSRYQTTRTTDTHPRGWVLRAGTSRPKRRLSFHILSSPKKKEYGPRRAPARLPGRNLKRRSFQPRKKAIKPQPQCVSYSEAASGLLTSLQGTDARANLPGSRNYSTHATDTHPRGWVRRAGNPPPCAASFFPYSFFAEEERIWPPGGRQPASLEEI